jgi:hypothetical protein
MSALRAKSGPSLDVCFFEANSDPFLVGRPLRFLSAVDPNQGDFRPIGIIISHCGVNVMTRYYFHFRNGILFEDDVGEEFSDPSHALQYARRVASELAEDGRSKSSVIVTDGGCQLFEIPLPENQRP